MGNLREYLEKSYPEDGDPALLDSLRPIFFALADRLEELNADATLEQRLSAFSTAIEAINVYADEIETVEREAILECIYDMGEIVGIARDSQFAEEWRGDW